LYPRNMAHAFEVIVRAGTAHTRATLEQNVFELNKLGPSDVPEQINPEFTVTTSRESLPIGRACESMATRLPNAREAADSCVPDREITRNDVLLGRGAASDRFQGNIQFRSLIRTRKNEYTASLHPQGKAFVSQQIVQAVQANHGRFLRKVSRRDERIQDIDSPMWEIVSDSVAVEKVKQAFRDMDHRSSAMRRASGSSLPDPPIDPPMNVPFMTPSADALFQHTPPTIKTGPRARIHSHVDLGHDPASHFFMADQSPHFPTQPVTDNALDRNVSQPHAESENCAMVLLAELATHQLPTDTSTTDTTSLIPTLPIPSFSAPTTAQSLPVMLPMLPEASYHSRLDLSSLAPDLLQRLGQQVAYQDLFDALLTPTPLSNPFTAAPFSLPAAPAAAAAAAAAAASSRLGLDWSPLLGGGSIPPSQLLAHPGFLASLPPPQNPLAAVSMSARLAAASTSPSSAATNSLCPSATLSNVAAAWEQIPGHYLSQFPLVHDGRLGPFTSTDWYLIRTALARAEATRNGSVMIQIRSVLQTAMTLPLHRVVLTREDIVAMAETLQRLTVLLSTVGGSVSP
jgi:hypothetical protein